MGIVYRQTISPSGSLLARIPVNCPVYCETASQKEQSNCDRITAFAIGLGYERLHPSLRNPDYLVLN